MRAARAGVLPAILLVAAFAPLFLPPTGSAGPEPPSLLATAYNTQRKLVAAPDGTLYAAITANASGVPAARVYSTRDGSAWSPLPTPPTSGNASDRTSLAIDSTGRLHLAWTEVTSVDRQVFYARFEGGAWVAKVQLSHSPGYAGFPSLAVDGGDRVHVAWYATDGVNYQIYYRRLEGSVWTPERALTFTSADATNPAIALGPDGAVHIVWARTASRALTEIAYLRLDGDVVTDSRAISAPGVASIAPSLAVNGSGTVHVVWSSSGQIQYRRGPGPWSAIEAVSGGAYIARNPSLALDAAGRVHVFWEAGDGGIYAQVRDGAWSAPARISGAGANTQPSARWAQFDNPLCDSAGRIDVIWTQEVNGTLRLAYRGIDARATCLVTPRSVDVGAWVVTGAVAVATGVLLARLRRRRIGPPQPP